MSSKDIFEKVWNSAQMEDNRVIELPNLNSKSLEDMLVNNAKKYRASYMNEVHKMTEIVDPQKTIKNEADSKQESERLIKMW